MRLWWALMTVATAGTAVDGLLAQYRTAGAAAPSAERGAALWGSTHAAADGSGDRSCTTCHGSSLDASGRHATTGEPIDPMTAPGRLEDPLKVEKWFGRNCRWTLGRECTPGEKADVLVYLSGGGR